MVKKTPYLTRLLMLFSCPLYCCFLIDSSSSLMFFWNQTKVDNSLKSRVT